MGSETACASTRELAEDRMPPRISTAILPLPAPAGSLRPNQRADLPQFQRPGRPIILIGGHLFGQHFTFSPTFDPVAGMVFLTVCCSLCSFLEFHQQI